MESNSEWASITFSTLIKNYIKLQASVVSSVRNIASHPSSATPGKFLLLQFMMSQVTQAGESISNLVSQVMSVINNTIRNMQKAG